MVTIGDHAIHGTGPADSHFSTLAEPTPELSPGCTGSPREKPNTEALRVPTHHNATALTRPGPDQLRRPNLLVTALERIFKDFMTRLPANS